MARDRVQRPPNMRVQRTRSSPSAPRSPLTRGPLGARIGAVGLALTTLGMVLPSPVQKNEQPLLVSSHLRPVFVTFAGYGKIEGRLSQEQSIVTPPADPAEREYAWLQLYNNTVWPIGVVATAGAVLQGPEWKWGLAVRRGTWADVHYEVNDRDGRNVTTQEWPDIIGDLKVPPGRSVLFPVQPAAFEPGNQVLV